MNCIGFCWKGKSHFLYHQTFSDELQEWDRTQVRA